MKYMMMIYANLSERHGAAPEEGESTTLSPATRLLPNFTPEERKAMMQAWAAFKAEAEAAGVLVSNETLYPVSDATTLRIRDGKRLISDGPFAETHEQLGGFFVLDCKDLDEAVEWAAKMPGAQYGSIEIRPVMSLG
ncbi:MAG TPA: YciI family protein [Oceanobacillus sp.]|nr:YciI family protein [Oceanobacillus sp.]